MLILTYKGIAPDAKNEYPFWRARLLHSLKQEELLYYLERFPPMEEYADGQGKDESEELARREKFQLRLKDDNAALSLVYRAEKVIPAWSQVIRFTLGFILYPRDSNS